MKILRYILFSLSILPAFTSCGNWLEEDPVTSRELDELARTQQGIEMLAVGAYSMLQPLYNFSNNPGVAGTDECMSLAINQMMAKPLDQYIFTPSNPIFSNAWNKSYAAIQSANIVIGRLYGAEMKEETRLRLMGEMRFLRAFVYFRLVQWFGELPLITTETPDYDKTVTNVSRAPIKDVYELITSDLEFAASAGILPAVAYDGRVSQSAAQALLAKVYLTMGTAKQRTLDKGMVPGYKELPLEPHSYYRKCYDLTDGIIKGKKYELMKSYGDLFLPAKKADNTECIWEIQFSDVASLGGSWSKYFGQLGEGGQTHTFNAMVGRHIYQPVPGFIGFYKRGDRRYAWNIQDHQVRFASGLKEDLPYRGPRRMNAVASWKPETLNAHLRGNTGLTEQVGCSKYRWGYGKNPDEYYLQNDMSMRYPWDNTPNNVPVLRLADVILMYAEADLLMNGGMPSQTAVDRVNTLLYRARDGKTVTEMWNNATNNQGEYTGTAVAAGSEERPYYLYDYDRNTLTYEELKKERARELCFEFHRWNDLVRWGDLESAVEGRMHASVAEAATGDVDPEKHYLFPIPQTEIDVSRIRQNPKYVAATGEF